MDQFRTRAPRTRAGAALLLAALLGAAPAPVAHAPPLRHTTLQATYPAADSMHLGDVLEVRLRYSTAVQRGLSTIALLGPDGPVGGVGPVETVPGTDEREIRVRLSAPLASGDYTVRWTTAGPDSHPLSGSFAFRVERAEPIREPAAAGDPFAGDVPTLVATGPQEESADAARDPAGILVRTGFLLSILGMLGTAVFRLAVLGPFARDPLLAETAGVAADRTRALAWSVAALIVVTLPARLWKQSADLFGADALDPVNLGRILGTQWGGGWLLQGAMGVLFVGGLASLRRRGAGSGGWWAMLFAGLGAALVPALSGHASATPAGVRAFAVLNDTLHVTAAGVWMGTLAVMVIAGLGSLALGGSAVPTPAGGAWGGEDGMNGTEHMGENTTPPSMLPPLARMVNGFSRVALFAVATLLLTGLISARFQLGSLAALVNTRYGLTLLLKLGVVVAAAAAGLYNWRVVRPALVRDPRPERLRPSATAEVLLGLLVVVVTAALIVTPLPPAP